MTKSQRQINAIGAFLVSRCGVPIEKAGARAVALVATAALLAACATHPEPKIVTQIVKVPVATVCPKDLRPPPVTPDTDEALRKAPGPDVRYTLVTAGRLLKNQWINEAWSVLTACK